MAANQAKLNLAPCYPELPGGVSVYAEVDHSDHIDRFRNDYRLYIWCLSIGLLTYTTRTQVRFIPSVSMGRPSTL